MVSDSQPGKLSSGLGLGVIAVATGAGGATGAGAATGAGVVTGAGEATGFGVGAGTGVDGPGLDGDGGWPPRRASRFKRI